jgi:tetratricopeptide (TPR) repeat protein
MQQTAAAKPDVDAALAINPHDGTALQARGELAGREKDYAAAVEAFSALLQGTPGYSPALLGRAHAYYAQRRLDLALADTDDAVKTMPANAELRLLRANILHDKGDRKGVTAEADALMSLAPNDVYSLAAASRIYAAVQQRDNAMHALDKAMAIGPTSYIYLSRYDLRPASDLAGRQSDIDAALRLEPTSPEGLTAKAHLQGEQGNWRGATETLSPLIARFPPAPTCCSGGVSPTPNWGMPRPPTGIFPRPGPTPRGAAAQQPVLGQGDYRGRAEPRPGRVRCGAGHHARSARHSGQPGSGSAAAGATG